MTPDGRLVTDLAVQFDAAHMLASDDVAARLKVELETGLKADQVLQRTKQYGPNQLPDAPLRSRGWYFSASLKAF